MCYIVSFEMNWSCNGCVLFGSLLRVFSLLVVLVVESLCGNALTPVLWHRFKNKFVIGCLLRQHFLEVFKVKKVFWEAISAEEGCKLRAAHPLRNP